MYFLIVIQVAKDGVTSQGIYCHDDFDSAKAAFHSELAYSISAKTLSSDLVMVMDTDGNILAQEKWVNADAE